MNRQRLPNRSFFRQSGFSLVELAIVLIIVTLLTSGLLIGLSAQRNLAENKDAQRQQGIILEAVLGFAMSSGRLPCPADPALATASGAGNEELQCTPSDCSTSDRICKFEHGVIPWRSLSLQETDPWGNRFTYFAGREFSNPITQAEKDNGTRTRFTLDTVGRANIQDNNGLAIASDIPAVIVSHGSHASGAYQSSGLQLAGASGDELENANATQTFVSYTPAVNFDDLVVWIIPSILKSRLVAVGKLP
jgi:prepilin-type N-terminal cleavage/methylation domain-containing protein